MTQECRLISRKDFLTFGAAMVACKHSMVAIIDHLYTRGFFRNRIFFGAQTAALFGNSVAWALVIANLGVIHETGREFIALHSKVFVGIDLYGQWYYLLTLPLGGAAVLVVNYLIGRRMWHENAHLSVQLAIASVSVQVIIAAALSSIIQVNQY